MSVSYTHLDVYKRQILEPRPQLDLSCGGHPNHAACLFVFITCIFFYLHIEELKKRYFIGLILMTIIMYIIIGSEALFVIFLLPIIWNFKDNKTVDVYKRQGKLCPINFTKEQTVFLEAYTIIKTSMEQCIICWMIPTIKCYCLNFTLKRVKINCCAVC